MCAQQAQKYIPDPRKDNLEAASAKLEKGGLKALVELLSSEDGQALLEAVNTMNIGLTRKPSKEAVKAAVKKYRKFFTTEPEAKRRILRKVSTFVARLYLFTATAVEHLDFHNHLEKWAALMHDVKRQLPEIQQLVKDPKNSKKLEAALVAAFMDKVNKQKKEKRRRSLSDDDEEDSDAESEPSPVGDVRKNECI